MKTVWLGVVGVVALVVIVWVGRSADDGGSGAAPLVGSTTGTQDNPVDVPSDTAAGESDSPFTVVEPAADQDTTDADTQVLSADVEPASDTPPTGQGSLLPLPNQPATDAAVGSGSSPDETATVPQSVPTAPVIEVPQTYPVSDADQYFIPAEERRPGNLGGPPPLDFPGGPGDPERSEAPLAAPPAPGQ